jgi:WASH complex subunit 7
MPYEQTTLLQLIDTDNKVLNKILVVFATLCAEVRCLQSEAKYKYYDTILFYGEGGTCLRLVQCVKQQNGQNFICTSIK